LTAAKLQPHNQHSWILGNVIFESEMNYYKVGMANNL